jgi:putative aldouronate transport system substrate-binding protein
MVGISCYWPVDGCIFDQKNDEVFFVPTSEEYKYLLSWLHKFYEEGMLDQELFTQTSEQRSAKNKADLVFMNHTYDDPELASYAGRSGAFFLDAPLTSAVSDKPLVALSAKYNVDIAAISAYTEYPEVCMLLLDYFYSAEATRVAHYGLEGVDYKLNEDGSGVTASDSWTYLNGPTTMHVNYWINDESEVPAKRGTALAQRRTEYCTDYADYAFQNYLKFTDEQATTLATLTADLGLYCDDYYVGVITGNYDLEKTWDEYVKKCEGMQLDKITEIYQDAYNVYAGIK